MESPIINDWRTIDLRHGSGVEAFMEAVQRYLTKPKNLKTTLDSPQQRVSFGPGADFGYERVFDIIDFTSTQKNSFDILNVGSGLTFRPKEPGIKAKIIRSDGERTTVTFDRYGGSLQWCKMWFDDAEFWNIEEATQHFRKQWYDDRAHAFYNLISASRPDSDLLCQGPSCATNLVRYAETINYACADIISSLASNGYDVNPQTRFVVVAPLRLAAYLQSALNIDSSELNFNLELVITDKLKNQELISAEADQYFVCLPGRKAKGGYRQDLTLLSETDILAYAETVAAWGRYGGVVGDAEQFRRCAID